MLNLLKAAVLVGAVEQVGQKKPLVILVAGQEIRCIWDPIILGKANAIPVFMFVFNAMKMTKIILFTALIMTSAHGNTKKSK